LIKILDLIFHFG